MFKFTLIIFAVVGLLASCKTKENIIYYKSLTSNPAISNYASMGKYCNPCMFRDSTNKYNVKDTVR